MKNIFLFRIYSGQIKLLRIKNNFLFNFKKFQKKKTNHGNALQQKIINKSSKYINIVKFSNHIIYYECQRYGMNLFIKYGKIIKYLIKVSYFNLI